MHLPANFLEKAVISGAAVGGVGAVTEFPVFVVLTVVVVVVVVAVEELSASSVLDSVCTVLRFPVSVPDAGALTFGYIIDSF